MVLISYRTFPIISLILCFLALPLLPAPAASAAAGPIDALRLMQKGVDTANSDTFNRGIDVNSVVNKASDTLLAALRRQAAEGHLADSNLGMVLGLADVAEGSGQAAFVKQILISEVKTFLATGVNGGYFAGKPNGKVKPSGMSLSGMLPKMPQGRREIIPGSVLSSGEGVAQVSATFVDPEAGRFPLVLALEQQGGQWKVVELVNAEDVFRRASRR